MSDHQHAACKALATADVGAVEVLGASSDSTAPSFNTAQHKEKAMTTPTKSEKPLLTLLEAGGVNDTPVPAPPITLDDVSSHDENMLLALRTAVKTAGKAAGSMSKLARVLGLSSAAIAQWKRIPAERIVEIERATGVRREVLRPDLYQRPTLVNALAIVRAEGYRVSKPRKQKNSKRGKDRVGPTCVAKFNDGTVTRMSTFTSLKNFGDRGTRLSHAAWGSRWRMRKRAEVGQLVTLWAPTPPAIVAMHFEQDGTVLAHYPNSKKATS